MGQQNLVYNGDFEIYDTCPSGFSNHAQSSYEIEKCLGWTAPTYGTSDFFHTCAVGTNVWIPTSATGYQYPYSGEGYLGGLMTSFTGGSGEDNYNGIMWWEYLQGQLISPLQEGKFYQIKMAINLAEESFLSLNQLGVYFSESAINSVNTANLNYSPQVTFYNEDYYKDTVNWMFLEGFFEASGGEQVLTIGNFKDNTETDTLRIKPIVGGYTFDVTYYYFDNIEIFDVTDDFRLPNVFTPNNDGLNDLWGTGFKDSDYFTITIVNRWGNVIKEGDFDNFYWDGSTEKGNQCSEGVYYYVLKEKKSKKTFKSGFIHLIR